MFWFQDPIKICLPSPISTASQEIVCHNSLAKLFPSWHAGAKVFSEAFSEFSTAIVADLFHASEHLPTDRVPDPHTLRQRVGRTYWGFCEG